MQKCKKLQIIKEYVNEFVGYIRSIKKSLNLRLKENKDKQRVISSGRSFQYLGPVKLIVLFAKRVRVRGR